MVHVRIANLVHPLSPKPTLFPSPPGPDDQRSDSEVALFKMAGEPRLAPAAPAALARVPSGASMASTDEDLEASSNSFEAGLMIDAVAAAEPAPAVVVRLPSAPTVAATGIIDENETARASVAVAATAAPQPPLQIRNIVDGGDSSVGPAVPVAGAADVPLRLKVRSETLLPLVCVCVCARVCARVGAHMFRN